MAKWVSVKDKMPKREQQVIFISEDKTMYVGSMCNVKTCKSFHCNTDSWDPNEIEDVTHWMTLPKLPECC